jgi:hypothetical protein
MLSGYHQSSPACALTTHPPQVAFFLDEPSVEFHPTDPGDALPVPVTSGGEPVSKGTGMEAAVAFALGALPFLPTSATDTTSGAEKGDPSVPFVAKGAGVSAVPTSEVDAGADVTAAASRIEVELSALGWAEVVGDDTEGCNKGAGAVPKAAGRSSPVPGGMVGAALGFGRSEALVEEGSDGDEA